MDNGRKNKNQRGKIAKKWTRKLLKGNLWKLFSATLSFPTNLTFSVSALCSTTCNAPLLYPYLTPCLIYYRRQASKHRRQ